MENTYQIVLNDFVSVRDKLWKIKSDIFNMAYTELPNTGDTGNDTSEAVYLLRNIREMAKQASVELLEVSKDAEAMEIVLQQGDINGN